MLEFELVYRVTSSCCPQTCQLSDCLIESNIVPYRPTLPVSQYRPLQTNVTCLTVSSLTDQRYLSHSIVPYRPTLPVSPYRPLQTNVTCLTVSSLTDQRYLSHSIVPYRPTLPVSQYRPLQTNVTCLTVSSREPRKTGAGEVGPGVRTVTGNTRIRLAPR